MDKPTPIWKEKIKEVNLEADAQADAELDKLKASKWSAVILLGAAVVIVLALMKLL